MNRTKSSTLRNKTVQGGARQDALFAASARKAPLFEFVLEAIAPLNPWTKPMFGCLAVYVKEKIVFLFCDKTESPDCGIWLATTPEHHASLGEEFPSMRPIAVFWKISGWQNLPADSADFEQAALKACELVLRGDRRIGKIPEGKKKAKPKK